MVENQFTRKFLRYEALVEGNWMVVWVFLAISLERNREFSRFLSNFPDILAIFLKFSELHGNFVDLSCAVQAQLI